MTGAADRPAVPVVAIAASAGGVEALRQVVAALPPDLPAAVLVALHLPALARSVLAPILDRVGEVPVRVAQTGEPLRPGTVVVAPPDSHLLVVEGRTRLGRGPRENGHRPSHDAMLRSVALDCGPYAVGVVLTGLLDDGAAGLAAVSRYGGTCLVQDPADSEQPSMPRAARAAVPSARCVPLAEIAREVVRAVDQTPQPAPRVDQAQRALDLAEVSSGLHGSPVLPDGSPPGTPSPFACPDCSGVLNQVPDGDVVRFRCRTGHAWTAESLGAQQAERVEESLWVALRVLEERADLSRRLSADATRGGRDWAAAHLLRQADEAERSAATVRGVLEHDLGGAARAVPPEEDRPGA